MNNIYILHNTASSTTQQ